MSNNPSDRFPDWNNLYKQDVKKMPWYNERLDADLENQLNLRNITKGRFLDLGTGPGTQAIQLAKIGFEVTGTDLSENAILKARELDNSIKFIADDILHSKLKSTFDYILDRGCFHVLPPDKRSRYTKKIHEILDDSGLFFLKCFSIKEKNLTYGPYRFSEDEIRYIFSKYFVIESITDVVYQGTLDPLPKALFSVMRKKI
ncbi:MAG: class I SAM-dependent methyltransferase [Candidatus Nitrosotalea sp.]|nr:class I SAM-dependent methyltransferase [Candidatus Nitrosotalea sp.]